MTRRKSPGHRVHGGLTPTVLTALLGLAAADAHAAPTLLAHVNGYTLSGAQLVRFDALAFDHGRMLATGEEAALRADRSGALRTAAPRRRVHGS